MMTTTTNKTRSGASFRDPSGFIFKQNGTLYRQVNQSYAQDFDLFVGSGLYEKLVKQNRLVAHSEVDISFAVDSQAYKVIRPKIVPFISYPYEWSFSQLKDAALTTLAIQKRALKFGMSLKDASAYNIQFLEGKPLFIDTLSFEKLPEGAPWVAYRQFCQHFLGPLALMAYTDVRLVQLLRVYIDGLPLDLVSRLLPARTRLNFGLLTHIHLHARAQKQFADKTENAPSGRSAALMSKQALIGLIESLQVTVKKLHWQPGGTEWGNYYEITNYIDSAFESKKEIVKKWVKRVQPARVWDFGANTGVFSRLASTQGAQTVAFDIDPSAVELNYLQTKKDGESNLLPLVLDLTNPSPSLGWHNQERDNVLARGPVDMVFALAVIHHLAISNNLPLSAIARFFAQAGRWLVIEFVPKEDSQVQKLLSSRKDIFDSYTREDFEQVFSKEFTIHDQAEIPDSKRCIYLMELRRALD